jgi:hypothetical protein
VRSDVVAWDSTLKEFCLRSRNNDTGAEVQAYIGMSGSRTFREMRSHFHVPIQLRHLPSFACLMHEHHVILFHGHRKNSLSCIKTTQALKL